MIKFPKPLVSVPLFRSFEFVSCFVFRDSNLLQIELVPRAGLEPAQSHDHEILSLARIPISPPRPVTSLAPSDVAASRFLFVPAPFLQLANNQGLLVIITTQFINIIHLVYAVNQRKKALV